MKQKEFDLAKARRVEEEGRKWTELVRQAAEWEKAKLEKTRAIECSQKEINAAEWELAAKKSALLQVEWGVGSDEDNHNDK